MMTQLLEKVTVRVKVAKLGGIGAFRSSLNENCCRMTHRHHDHKNSMCACLPCCCI